MFRLTEGGTVPLDLLPYHKQQILDNPLTGFNLATPLFKVAGASCASPCPEHPAPAANVS